jgi:hypothetical protein
MKTKKIKARYTECYDNKTFKIKAYVELPADAASVDTLVEQITKTWAGGHYKCTNDLARAALASIGINARVPKS